MKYGTFVIITLLALAGTVSPQNPPKEKTPEKPDDVVVVTTNLVQVDAVVTDKNGKPVTDLTAEDFELLEDGHEREIKAFSYVPLTTQTSVSQPKPAANTRRNLPPVTLHAERPENVRRAIAILVDDFGLSAESIGRLRGGLEKFIDEQTSPNDLIAIIRASGGPGAMQQFTSNHSQLISTVKAMRWYPIGRGGMSAVESYNPVNDDENGVEMQGYSSSKTPNLSSKEYFPGSLAALGFVLHGLSRFPGRKSIVFISDNLPVTSRAAQIGGITGILDKMVQFANRNSIVISTMDARGLPKAGLTADDSQYNLAANQIGNRGRDRNIRFNVEQDAMSYLANQTGGVFVRYNTDLNYGLRRIVDSEQGYYLMAYRPDDAATETGGALSRTYKVTVRLRRPDLVLRTRSAFHRITAPKETDSGIKEQDDFLREALSSPFVREDVGMKMTALYTGASQIKVLLHIKAQSIEMVKSPDNIYKGSFDVVAVAFDNNGKVGGEVRKTPMLSIPAAELERAQRDGFDYALVLAVKNPGAYQVRVALRDAGSGRLGSDSQVVEVPDAGKTRLSVTGFMVQGMAEKNDQTETAGLSANMISGTKKNSNRGAAVRRFATGDLLTYSYLIYGVKKNRPADQQLLGQIRLFRGDKELFTGSVQPVAIANDSTHDGIIAGGSLRLGKELPPGQYFLEVIVTDKSAPLDRQTSEQWIDFEIAGPEVGS